MFGKPVRMIVVLASAAGIPYVWYNPELSKGVKQKWKDLSEQRATASTNDYDFGARFLAQSTEPSDRSTAGHAGSPNLTGGVMALEDVLRFDVSPRWVMQHWSRVSTIQADRSLEGLRVPLVTGTELHDVAGSLTYYFDQQQQLRRIMFNGHVGDERQVIALVARYFNLRREPALGAGFFIARWNGKPTGMLRISRSPVIRAQAPHERLQITLEINQPTNGYGLSPGSQDLLNQNRLTSRS